MDEQDKLRLLRKNLEASDAIKASDMLIANDFRFYSAYDLFKEIANWLSATHSDITTTLNC